MMPRVVSVDQAHAWTCPNCQQRNYCEAVPMELTPDELAELQLEHGVDPEETGAWTHCPARVCCCLCGSEYQTRDSALGFLPPDEPE